MPTFPELTGWLYKEGVNVKSWKKRYFVLRPNALYYYTQAKANSEKKGYILYQELNVCTVLTSKRAPTRFCFAVRHKSYNTAANSTPESPYRILCADTPSERISWMAAIIRAKAMVAANPSLAGNPIQEVRAERSASTIDAILRRTESNK